MKDKTSTILIFSLAINFLLVIDIFYPKLDKFLKQNLDKQISSVQNTPTNSDNIYDLVNPPSGFEIPIQFGNLGPKLISLGIIDPQKFVDLYEKSGEPLSETEKDILTKGSTTNIKITRENSRFLLNFFWAVGLANKSQVLTDGEITKYGGRSGIGSFASTGGWTLSKGKSTNYFSQSTLIPLTTDQEKLVAEISSNIYRPCCNNSTAFPDCNHGMALLGVIELLAANNVDEKDIYTAAKYFNAFWFPSNYFDIALYFQNKDNLSFSQLDGKLVLGKNYSSLSGIQSVRKWLAEKNLLEIAPKQGGSCGV